MPIIVFPNIYGTKLHVIFEKTTISAIYFILFRKYFRSPYSNKITCAVALSISVIVRPTLALINVGSQTT